MTKILKIFINAMLAMFIGIVNVFAYEVGDIIEFGSYPYEADGTEKPIEWQILEKYTDGTALVISKYGLDSVKYNSTKTEVTWENSTIRKWLNNEFYNKAFRNTNKNLIIENYLETEANVQYGTRGGNNTFDKIYLLSIYGAKSFSRDKEMKAFPTPYANLKTKDKGEPCWWWLRSPGGSQDSVANVNHYGLIDSDGLFVDNENIAVRPALKINLKNLRSSQAYGKSLDTKDIGDKQQPPQVTGAKNPNQKTLEKNYNDIKNSQKVDILALRYGSHKDRTRLVFDISDACVWQEKAFQRVFDLSIKGADSKLDANEIKIRKGHEIKDVQIGRGNNNETVIRIDKGKTGGYVQVQLLDNPYRIVIDVFKLKRGQTQEQQHKDYLAGIIPLRNLEDKNEYKYLLSEKDKQKSEDDITDADRDAVRIKPLKQTAGKRTIVIDPGHGGYFEGTYFASGAFMGYEDKIQYTYETVDGKEQKIPLIREITEGKFEYITKQVPKYEEMIWEHDITLAQAKAIKAYFNKPNSPFKVILTREKDEQLGRTLGSDLAYRGEFALKNKAAAFISMHVNFMGDDYKQECSARGFEIMYRSIGGDSDNGRLDYLKGDTPHEREQDKTLMLKAKEQGKNLANIVSGNLKKHFVEHQPPNIDKEMGRKWSIAVLRMARYPAILIETGYLCNKEDRELLQQSDTNNKIAEALYNSLKEYFGIK